MDKLILTLVGVVIVAFFSLAYNNYAAFKIVLAKFESALDIALFMALGALGSFELVVSQMELQDKITPVLGETLGYIANNTGITLMFLLMVYVVIMLVPSSFGNWLNTLSKTKNTEQ